MTSQETSGSILPIVLLFTCGVVVLLLAIFVIFYLVDTLILGVFGVFCYIIPCENTGIVTWYKTLVLVFSFISFGFLIYFFVTKGISAVEVSESRDSSS